MNSPHVSICVPAYQQVAPLIRTLKSIFEQTFDDFEVVITDDSSSAVVEKAIEPWRTDPRLKYFRNSERLGSPGNWNRAMELSRGQLIKFLHHDDWFANGESLQEYVNLVDRSPKAMFAFSGAYARDESGVLLFTHAADEQQILRLKADPRCLFDGNFIGAPSATIFRRMAGLTFDENLTWLVDIAAYIQILRAHRNFNCTSKPLVNVTASASHQVTRRVQADRTLQYVENTYVYKSLGVRGMPRLKYLRHFFRLARNLTVKEVSAISCDERASDSPYEVKVPLIVRNTWLKARQLVDRRPGAAQGDALNEQPAKRSYSQCGEDLIVDFLFMWLGKENRRYLDIGANHPKDLNNTYLFYERGVRGVLIEPDPGLFRRLRKVRPEDVCLNVAVGVDGRPAAKMYRMSSRTLNTLVKSQAAEYESYGREKIEAVFEVLQRDINDILATEFAECPNYVSLDVEGLDLEILKKWDFERFRPDVMCIETLTFTQNGTERKLTEITELMKAYGYLIYADTYINTIFVSVEAWRARLH